MKLNPPAQLLCLLNAIRLCQHQVQWMILHFVIIHIITVVITENCFSRINFTKHTCRMMKYSCIESSDQKMIREKVIKQLIYQHGCLLVRFNKFQLLARIRIELVKPFKNKKKKLFNISNWFFNQSCGVNCI